MAAQTGDLTLELRRVLPAARTRVFKALTDAEELANWWGPSGFTCPSVNFAPRVGGSYRIAMQPPEGELFYLTGEFREIEPPAHLAYTFRWEDPDPDDQETVATLALQDLGESTELALAQGPFATEPRLELHRAGWTDAFVRLEELMSSSAPA